MRTLTVAVLLAVAAAMCVIFAAGVHVETSAGPAPPIVSPSAGP